MVRYNMWLETRWEPMVSGPVPQVSSSLLRLGVTSSRFALPVHYRLTEEINIFFTTFVSWSDTQQSLLLSEIEDFQERQARFDRKVAFGYHLRENQAAGNLIFLIDGETFEARDGGLE